jgi:hypothetical protein
MKSEILRHFQEGKLPYSLPVKVIGGAEALAQSALRRLA